MRMTGVALALICAACGSERTEKAKTGSDGPPGEPGMKQGSSDSTTATATGTATASTSTPAAELRIEGFYRSPGGTMIVLLPKALRAIPHKVHAENDTRLLELRVPSPNVMVFIIASAPATATFDAQFAELAKTAQLTGAVERRDLGDLPGGKGTRLALGPGPNGLAAVGVQLTDGSDRAGFVAVGDPARASKLIDELVAGARVGSKVPRLVDRKPSVPLDGLYMSAVRAFTLGTVLEHEADWAMFDRRGYHHTRAPIDEASLDMEAMVQWASLEKQDVYTYDLAGDTLTLTPITPGGKPFKQTLKVDGDKISFVREISDPDTDDTRRVSAPYWRAEGTVPDGTKLDRAYTNRSGYATGQQTYSERQTFAFTAAGEVSFETGETIIADTTGPSGTITGNAAGVWNDRSFQGTYQIAGGRLRIETRDGRSLRLPIAKPVGKDSWLFIGGKIYK